MSKEKALTGKWHIETVAINVPVDICGIPVKPATSPKPRGSRGQTPIFRGSLP